MKGLHKKITMQKNVFINIKKRKRITYIDNMKGFAMLCVVLGHIADGYLRSEYYSSSQEVLYAIYNIIYSFHMPLFIMISGYLYQTAYVEESGEIKLKKVFNQIGNLMLIYIEFSFLLGIFKIFCSNYVNTEITWKQLFLIGIKTIAPYWYIYILIAFYMLFSINRISKCSDKILLVSSFLVNLFSGKVDGACWFEVKRIMYYLFFWTIGFVYARRKEIFLFNKKIEFLMGAISISLMIVFWNNNKFICQIPIVNLVVAVGVCLIVWNIFEKHIYMESNNTLIFGKIGKYCLEIYLLHCFFTAGYRVLFNKCGISNLYISMIFNLVLSIGISVLIAKLCKKMGIYEVIFKPFSCISRRKV